MRLINLEKNRLVDSNGLSRDDYERSNIFKDYQLHTDKSDRLNGSWTLSQYDRMFEAAMLSEIKSNTPSWQYGDVIPDDALSELTMQDVEARIESDGRYLSLSIDPDIQRILDEQEKYIDEWTFRL